MAAFGSWTPDLFWGSLFVHLTDVHLDYFSWGVSLGEGVQTQVVTSGDLTGRAFCHWPQNLRANNGTRGNPRTEEATRSIQSTSTAEITEAWRSSPGCYEKHHFEAWEGYHPKLSKEIYLSKGFLEASPGVSSRVLWGLQVSAKVHEIFQGCWPYPLEPSDFQKQKAEKPFPKGTIQATNRNWPKHCTPNPHGSNPDQGHPLQIMGHETSTWMTGICGTLLSTSGPFLDEAFNFNCNAAKDQCREGEWMEWKQCPQHYSSCSSSQ